MRKDIRNNSWFLPINKLAAKLWGAKVEFNAYFPILKICSNIKNSFSNIKTSFSNIRNWSSNIKFLIIENEFLTLQIEFLYYNFNF